MGALDAEAYVEAACDLLVAEDVSEALEHLPFARGYPLDDPLDLAPLLARTARLASSSLTSLIESNASPATRRRTTPMIWSKSAVLCRMPAAPASTARVKS